MNEQAAVLALTEATQHEWYKTAALIVEAGGATALLEGRTGTLDEDQRDAAERLASRVTPDILERAEALIRSVQAQGIRLVTVLDEDYP